jgi:dual specificity phosphatase 12
VATSRFAARSVSLLKSLNISYVLSVTRPEDLPKFNSGDGAESETSASKDELVVKHIDINDDPTEDILQYLKDACDWIETSLTAEPTKAEVGDPKQVGVLVHCTQGISRSGSIVIAYCKHSQTNFEPNMPLVSHCS